MLHQSIYMTVTEENHSGSSVSILSHYILTEKGNFHLLRNWFSCGFNVLYTSKYREARHQLSIITTLAGKEYYDSSEQVSYLFVTFDYIHPSYVQVRNIYVHLLHCRVMKAVIEDSSMLVTKQKVSSYWLSWEKYQTFCRYPGTLWFHVIFFFWTTDYM